MNKKLLLLLFLLLCLTACQTNGAKQINSVSDLKGQAVGVVNGMEFNKAVKAILPNDVELINFSTYMACAESTINGKTAGFVVDENVAKEMVMKNPNLKILNPALSNDPYAYITHQSKTDVANKANEVIKQMKQDGELIAIRQKWASADESKRVMPKFEFTGENGELKIATSTDAAPFVYLRYGEIVGSEIEIAYTIAQRLGYTPKVYVMDTGAIVPTIESKKMDLGVYAIPVTEESKKSILFLDTVYEGGVVIVTKK